MNQDEYWDIMATLCMELNELEDENINQQLLDWKYDTGQSNNKPLNYGLQWNLNRIQYIKDTIHNIDIDNGR
jgi:hypothetical protein